MQLLKVQERINALPLNAASLSYLDRAAKGMDTEIPPFMALAGMNEMKRNMEYASTGQPPEEPINESLPKQVAQQMGLGQPMQQGQPMQPGQPQGQPMPPPGQLAQGIAQPMQQMPQQMARGGLASVRIDPRMFDYGSGGVVSFAEGERVYASPGRFGNADSDQIEPTDDDKYTTREEAQARIEYLRGESDAERAKEGPVQETADVIEARRRKEGNYGASTGPLGEEYLTGLAQIQQLKEAERARRAQDNKSRDFLGISNALIAAGNATRGQSGMGGLLSGFGQQAGQEMIASQERDAALRGQGITEAEILNTAKSTIQNLRQAKLSGDVAQVVKLQSELADLASKARTANMTSLSAELTAMARILSADITAGKGTRSTDEAANVEEYLRARRALGDKRNPDVIRSEGRQKRLATIAALAQRSEAIVSTANTAEAGQSIDKEDKERRASGIAAALEVSIRKDAADNVKRLFDDFQSTERKKRRALRIEDEKFNNPKSTGVLSPFLPDPSKPSILQNKAEEYEKEVFEKEVTRLRAAAAAAAARSSGAPAAAAGAGAKPNIKDVEGAPPNSDIGAFVPNKGWEIKDPTGKVIGYTKDK